MKPNKDITNNKNMENTIKIRQVRNGFIIEKSWYGEVLANNLDELLKEIRETYED